MADRVAKLAGGGREPTERRSSFFSIQHRRPSVDPGHIDSIVKIAASKAGSHLLHGADSMLTEEEIKGSFFKQKQVFYENTYKMGPDRKFNRKKAEIAAYEVFDRHHIVKGDTLNAPYDPETAGKLCITLSNEIKAKVKEYGFPRYKIVVEVTCIPYQDQGLRMASRCLCDDKTDDFVCVRYDLNGSMKVIALIFGIYYE